MRASLPAPSLGRLDWSIWRPGDLETQACQIVGDEFYDRFRSLGTGLHPVQWLRALAEETGAALRAALAEGADDWQKLWALLCGLALTAPRTPADAADETASEKFPEFPDIEYPLETALAEAEKSAALAAGRGAEPGLGRLADGCRPAGESLVARDVSGSRYVLVARSAMAAARRITGMPGTSTCAGSTWSSAPACSPRQGTRCVNGAMPSARRPAPRRCRRARPG